MGKGLMRGTRMTLLLGMLSRLFRVVAGFSVLMAVAGCASHSKKTIGLPDELPKGEPLISIMITRGAFRLEQAGADIKFVPAKSPLGWAFYVEHPDTWRASLGGYRLEGEEIKEYRAYSSSVLKDIEAIDFEPFELWDEVAIAKARWGETPEGKDLVRLRTFDGAEYEIIINSKRGRFSMRERNPSEDILFYAPFSEKIAKLKRVIDTLALHMGRKQLRLGRKGAGKGLMRGTQPRAFLWRPRIVMRSPQSVIGGSACAVMCFLMPVLRR